MRRRKCWRIIQCTNVREVDLHKKISDAYFTSPFSFFGKIVCIKFWKKFGIVTSTYACNTATFVVLAVFMKYNSYFQVESTYNKQPSLNSCTRILMHLRMDKVSLILPSWYKSFLKEKLYQNFEETIFNW